jgi:hypothetical protein
MIMATMKFLKFLFSAKAAHHKVNGRVPLALWICSSTGIPRAGQARFFPEKPGLALPEYGSGLVRIARWVSIPQNAPLPWRSCNGKEKSIPGAAECPEKRFPQIFNPPFAPVPDLSRAAVQSLKKESRPDEVDCP